jgi:hypothetical protein
LRIVTAATAARPTATESHSAAKSLTTHFVHLLDSRFDDLPFVVVLDLHLLAEPFHHALLHLGGIKITPALTLALATLWAGIIVVVVLSLRLERCRKDGSDAGNSQQVFDVFHSLFQPELTALKTETLNCVRALRAGTGMSRASRDLRRFYGGIAMTRAGIARGSRMGCAAIAQ